MTDRRDALSQMWQQMFGFLESQRDGAVLVNADNAITLVNAALERITGYRRSELMSMSLADLIPPDAAHPHTEAMDDYGATAGQEHAPMSPLGNVPLRRRDGTVIRVRVERFVTTNIDGRPSFGGWIRPLESE